MAITATAGQALPHSISGEGDPVLLVHGLGANREDWRDVAPRLARHYRVIAVDLRGFGACVDQPGPYGPEVFAMDVLATLDALQLPRVRLVGHSMGGAVALTLALKHPERVAALFLANSVPSFQPEQWRDHLEVLLRLVMMAVLGPRLLGRLMARRMFPEEGQAALRDFIELRAAHNRRGPYLKSLYALTRWSARGQLGELCIPTAIAASGNDYFSVAAVREFAESIPGAEFHLFETARHGLPLENGPALSDCIASFFARSAGAVPATTA